MRDDTNSKKPTDSGCLHAPGRCSTTPRLLIGGILGWWTSRTRTHKALLLLLVLVLTLTAASLGMSDVDDWSSSLLPCNSQLRSIYQRYYRDDRGSAHHQSLLGQKGQKRVGRGSLLLAIQYMKYRLYSNDWRGGMDERAMEREEEKEKGFCFASETMRSYEKGQRREQLRQFGERWNGLNERLLAGLPTSTESGSSVAQEERRKELAKITEELRNCRAGANASCIDESTPTTRKATPSAVAWLLVYQDNNEEEEKGSTISCEELGSVVANATASIDFSSPTVTRSTSTGSSSAIVLLVLPARCETPLGGVGQHTTVNADVVFLSSSTTAKASSDHEAAVRFGMNILFEKFSGSNKGSSGSGDVPPSDVALVDLRRIPILLRYAASSLHTRGGGGGGGGNPGKGSAPLPRSLRLGSPLRRRSVAKDVDGGGEPAVGVRPCVIFSLCVDGGGERKKNKKGQDVGQQQQYCRRPGDQPPSEAKERTDENILQLRQGETSQQQQKHPDGELFVASSTLCIAAPTSIARRALYEHVPVPTMAARGCSANGNGGAGHPVCPTTAAMDNTQLNSLLGDPLGALQYFLSQFTHHNIIGLVLGPKARVSADQAGSSTSSPRRRTINPNDEDAGGVTEVRKRKDFLRRELLAARAWLRRARALYGYVKAAILDQRQQQHQSDDKRDDKSRDHEKGTRRKPTIAGFSSSVLFSSTQIGQLVAVFAQEYSQKKGLRGAFQNGAPLSPTTTDSDKKPAKKDLLLEHLVTLRLKLQKLKAGVEAVETLLLFSFSEEEILMSPKH